MPTSREISGYFDREYFALHPGKVRYLDYLRQLLADWGVTRGRVLDIGSGYGFFLAALAQAGYSPFGLELALEAATASRQHSPVPVLIGSAEAALPFGSGRLDAITMLDVIEHLHHFEAALANCHAALAPGGIFIVITLNAGSLARPLLGRRWSFHLDPTHVHMFSARRLRDSLEQARLQVLRLTTISNFCNVGEGNPALKPLRRIGRVVSTPWLGDSLLAIARRPS
jgi:SAM-dependent methyltransferase